MTTATDTRRAIAFLRVDISPSTLDRTLAQIANYATDQSLKIAKSMRITPSSIDPEMRLIEAMRLHEIDLVIVPSLLHVPYIKRDITAIGDLHAVTGETWERGFEWPKLPAPFPIARGPVWGG